MPDEDRRRRRKKKKKPRSTASDDVDEEAGGGALLIDQGEAEFANTAAINADNEPILVANVEDDTVNYDNAVVVAEDDNVYNAEEQPAITLVQADDDDEDAIPAPIAEPDSNGSGLDPDVPAFQDGLAVATAVDTAAEDEFIYSAIEYDPDSKPPLHTNRRFRVYTCFAFMVVIAVVSIVVVYVTKSSKGTEYTDVETMWGGAPSFTPTMSPVTNREVSGIKEQLEFGVLQRGANFSSMDKTDPRYKALDWILHADQLQLDSDDTNLYQRYILALLAFTLDSTAWFACGEHRKFGNVTEDFAMEDCKIQNSQTGQIEDHKVWLSSTEECEWYGVICSQDEVVRGVELIGNDLIGEIPPEISELRFLQYLALNGNCLFGTIPPEFGKMPNLLSLELHGNGLSGQFPLEMYDANKLQLLNVAMQYGYAVSCTMSNGTYVNTIFKKGGVTTREPNLGLEGPVLMNEVDTWSSMKGLHLFDNSFWGNITNDIGNLKYLVFLRAHNNQLNGYLPDGMTRLKKLREVYLENNGFWGDLPPTIGDMEDLEVLRVNENEMYGQIPDSLYDLKKLKKLWLQDTYECLENEDLGWVCNVESNVGFKGTISTKIGNLKRLSQLLINENPFTGTIPTEIGLCEDLALLHIHKTSIKGPSPQEVCNLRDLNLNSETGTGVFYADCRPNNKTEDPFFACDCCSDCCDHTTKVCIADD